MTASKEQAVKASGDIELMAVKLDAAIPDKQVRDEIKRILIRVQEFVERAEKRLPTQAAIDKDRQRKKG